MDSDLEQQIDRFYGLVGRNVRLARARTGFTQSQLASSIGVTRSSVANLEAGRQRVPLHLLALVAVALRVRFADLLPEAPVLENMAAMPDLTEHLANDLEGMRSFVQNTVTKATSATRRQT